MRFISYALNFSISHVTYWSVNSRLLIHVIVWFRSCLQVALHIPGAYNLTMHLPIIIGTVPYRRAQAFHFTESQFYRETQAHFRAMEYLSVPDPPPYRETITPPPPFEGTCNCGTDLL